MYTCRYNGIGKSTMKLPHDHSSGSQPPVFLIPESCKDYQ